MLSLAARESDRERIFLVKCEPGVKCRVRGEVLLKCGALTVSVWTCVVLCKSVCVAACAWSVAQREVVSPCRSCKVHVFLKEWCRESQVL